MFAARAVGRELSPKGVSLGHFAAVGKQQSPSSMSAIWECSGPLAPISASFPSFYRRDDDSKAEIPPSSSALTNLTSPSFAPLPRSFAASAAPSDKSEDSPQEFASSTFMVLSVAHATLATAAFTLPEITSDMFFPGLALPEGMQTQALVQLLGCGLAATSASSFALHQAAKETKLAGPTAQRLQLGLMGFSVAAIGTHLLYATDITVASLLGGAAVMGTTFYVPWKTYTAAVGKKPGLGEPIARYIGAVPDHLRINGMQSVLYSALTPTLALAGAAYLALPGYSMAAAFGYVKDVSSFFFWQNIGGGLLTVLPTMTYSLKCLAAGTDGKINEPIGKTLSAGLLVASLGHLAVLLPMVQAGQGGDMLHFIVGAWATGAFGGLWGLLGGGGKVYGG